MPERTRNLLAVAVIALSGVVVAVTMASTDPGDADRVHALASGLKCPVCESESIADSPSAIARDLYDLIAERVADGWSDDEIVDSFVATYGERVLLDPPVDARTIALWVVPLVAALAGLAVILSRRASAPGRALTDDERTRLASELREREEA